MEKCSWKQFCSLLRKQQQIKCSDVTWSTEVATVTSVYSYSNVCRGITSSKVDLEQEGFAQSEDNIVPKYLKVLLLMCWTMVVSLLWMILLQEGTSCQYISLYKFLKQQYSLCFPQLWKSLSCCLRTSECIGLWGVCKIRLLPPEEIYMFWAKWAFVLVLAVPGQISSFCPTWW